MSKLIISTLHKNSQTDFTSVISYILEKQSILNAFSSCIDRLVVCTAVHWSVGISVYTTHEVQYLKFG